MGKLIPISQTSTKKANKIARKRAISLQNCVYFKFAGDPDVVAVNITCGICLDIMVQPHLTPCRHFFCLDCVSELPRCPNCRKNFPQCHDILPHEQLAAAILQYVRCRLPREATPYRKRISKSQSALRGKFYPTNKLFPGLRVDFRYEKAWHQGVITRVDREVLPAKLWIAPLYLKRRIVVDVRSQRVARFRRWTLNGKEDDRTYISDLAAHRDLFEVIRATENSSHDENAKQRRVSVLREEQERIKAQIARINGEDF